MALRRAPVRMSFRSRCRRRRCWSMMLVLGFIDDDVINTKYFKPSRTQPRHRQIGKPVKVELLALPAVAEQALTMLAFRRRTMLNPRGLKASILKFAHWTRTTIERPLEASFLLFTYWTRTPPRVPYPSPPFLPSERDRRKVIPFVVVWLVEGDGPVPTTAQPVQCKACLTAKI